MPSLPNPNVFKNLIPRANSSLCNKIFPTISSFIQHFNDYYGFLYGPDGNFSDQFKSFLCEMRCVSNNLPTCPDSIIIKNITPGNNTLTIEFVVTGRLPFNYSIYRAETDTGPWGSPIASGASNNSTVVYNDTGVINGSRYYYKIQVSKQGCDTIEKVSDHYKVPSNCPMLPQNLRIYACIADGKTRILITGQPGYVIPDGTAVMIYRSDRVNVYGDLIVSGDYINGNNYIYIDPTTGYYYRARLREKPECDWIEIGPVGATTQC